MGNKLLTLPFVAESAITPPKKDDKGIQKDEGSEEEKTPAGLQAG